MPEFTTYGGSFDSATFCAIRSTQCAFSSMPILSLLTFLYPCARQKASDHYSHPIHHPFTIGKLPSSFLQYLGSALLVTLRIRMDQHKLLRACLSCNFPGSLPGRVAVSYHVLLAICRLVNKQIHAPCQFHSILALSRVSHVCKPFAARSEPESDGWVDV